MWQCRKMDRKHKGKLWEGIFVAGCLALCVTGCKVERPDTVLSDQQMADVLYDYHVAKAMGEVLPGGQNYKKELYVQSVFAKHGITEAQFDSSMVWFARYPEPLTKIYEQVNKRLKNERDIIDDLIALRDNKPKDTRPGDSIDVWAWQKIYRLTGVPLNNKILFTRPSDANFQERDTLVWSVRFRFPQGRADSLRAPVMAMEISYEKDTIVSGMLTAKSDGVKTIKLWADTLGAIKEINGFIYYPTQRVEQDMVADHISLMRYHAKDSIRTATAESPKIPAPDAGTKNPAKTDSITKNTRKDTPAPGTIRRRPSGNRKKIELPQPSDTGHNGIRKTSSR